MAKRKFNKWLLMVLGAGLILFTFVVATTGEPEPEHAGKTLSQWLEEANMEKAEASAELLFGGTVTSISGPATDAVRAMGEEVLPHLLRRLRARETWLTRAQDKVSEYTDLVSEAPDVLQIQRLAKLGFEILGTNAWPAIPQLSRLLVDTNSAMLAAGSLCELGAPGVKTVHSALLDPKISDAARAEIVFALTWRNGRMQNEIDQTEILPVVMSFLDSPHNRLRFWSASYLHEIHGDPSVMVPVLVARLDHSDPKTRAYIARALGSYGTNAIPAIPKLEVLLEQPNEQVDQIKTLHDFYRPALKSIRGGW